MCSRPAAGRVGTGRQPGSAGGAGGRGGVRARACTGKQQGPFVLLQRSATLGEATNEAARTACTGKAGARQAGSPPVLAHPTGGPPLQSAEGQMPPPLPPVPRRPHPAGAPALWAWALPPRRRRRRDAAQGGVTSGGRHKKLSGQRMKGASMCEVPLCVNTAELNALQAGQQPKHRSRSPRCLKAPPAPPRSHQPACGAAAAQASR